MNYGELKEQIRDLGFAEDSEITEFDEVVPHAVNRAITEINLTVIPIIGTYQITQDGTAEGYLYYDMEELADDFLEFADTPVMTGDGVYQKFNDFEIEQDRILVIDASLSGTYKIFYKKAHTPLTIDSDDSQEIELPKKAHYLVPLLASYYIWLEDEKSKAVDYYNQYDKLVQEIQEEKSKPRARILTGGI